MFNIVNEHLQHIYNYTPLGPDLSLGNTALKHKINVSITENCVTNKEKAPDVRKPPRQLFIFETICDTVTANI